MKNIFFFGIIILFLSSCNTLKYKNKMLNNSESEFQYETYPFWKKQPLSTKIKRENFQFIFLHKFNDSVFISSKDKYLFKEKVVTNEITDKANISFQLDVDSYNKQSIKIKVPSKKIDVNFHLSKSYRIIYFFYYEEKVIIRYSNYLYL